MTEKEQKAVEEFANTYNKQKWDRLQYSYVDAVIAGAQFLDELHKPSEPKTNVGEAGEELVEIIRNILVSNEKLENVWISPKWSLIPIIGHYQFEEGGHRNRRTHATR